MQDRAVTDEQAIDNPDDLVARYRDEFPTLQLPPQPFDPAVRRAAPATSLDDRPVGGYDSPEQAWTNPLPAVDDAAPVGFTWQITPEPPTPEATPGLVPAPTPVPVAQMATTSTPTPAESAKQDAPAQAHERHPASIVDPAPADNTSAALPRGVFIVLLALAGGLAWASRMAFSASLLGLAALVASNLAIAISLTRRSSQPRPTSATLFAGIAGIGAAITALLAFREFTDEFAFVAGLFMLITIVPSLIAIGVVLLVLRKAPAGAPIDALRRGLVRMLPVLAAALVAGIQAHRTFSAKPDAIVAMVVVVLVAMNVAAVLRGSGRAAGS